VSIRKVYVVTRNPGKLREIKSILGQYGLAVEPCEAEKVEIQSDSLEEIVRFAAAQVAGSLPEPFVVEDSGLFIKHLNGFPGPYSSYVYRTIGCEGILKLMENVNERRAFFLSVAALCLGGEIRVFTGKVEGTISREKRGSQGFGFDPIFIPSNCEKTFAEMNLEEKCRISHRAKSFRAIAEYLLSYCKNTTNINAKGGQGL